ncbi:UDP-2,3-diacylglucosamine diphosphatase [Chitinimonas koreensis]|uniref:UDP-2,3-diacylglucosamine diphosphatase n=1 Tax=Chitinimonas koreensis TaxID=356302 RepID=UPI000401D8E1|nr:UDP-2,3-diacylglucosamine diphosphatase [Chitinimonas koreensis]QNM95843.1 UDP-2,3-diacylglucosamine diphosphatase [Chitinimonas koreensis]
MTRPLLFASDLHLSDSDPATRAAFAEFLHGPARQAAALYLLGDIFEYWAGDDDDDPFNAGVAAELRALAEAGTAVHLMHGNRDFLLGPAFAAAAGATLLADPTLVEIGGRRLLLSHGDALCTDDAAYQQFRATVRQPAWQAAFLARPLGERRAEIARIRAASEMAKREKALDIMDVNPYAVTTLLAQYPGAHLIHGHTHRPAMHHHEVQHGRRERWVLPDWYGGTGGYLEADQDGLRFVGINQDAAWG